MVERYYNACPFCGGPAREFNARPLPVSMEPWSPDDPLPRYQEDVTCFQCRRTWTQTRRGSYGELMHEQADRKG